jgi:hypothetical protein
VIDQPALQPAQAGYPHLHSEGCSTAKSESNMLYSATCSDYNSCCPLSVRAAQQLCQCGCRRLVNMLSSALSCTHEPKELMSFWMGLHFCSLRYALPLQAVCFGPSA